MNLDSLDGVGPRLASRIRTRFGSDAVFMTALRSLDMDAVTRVEGVSPRRAASWMRSLRGESADDDLCATAESQALLESIHRRILSFAATRHGRARLHLLAPLTDQAEAQQRMEQVLATKERLAATDADRLVSLLRRMDVDPKARNQTADVLLVAESDAVHDRLREWDGHRFATLGTPRDLASAGDYDLVVVAYDDGNLDVGSVANAVEVDVAEGQAAVCPWSILGPLGSQRPRLEAASELATLADRASVAGDLLACLDQAGTPAFDPDTFRKTVQTLHDEADATLGERMSGMDVNGAEMLRALSTGDLPPAVGAVVKQVVDDACIRLREATGVSIRPFRAGLPITVDEDEVERVCRDAAARDHMETFRRLQKAAGKAARLGADWQKELAAWWDFDADQALGRFALAHDLHAVRFTPRLAFTGALHLDLAGYKDAQRVGYHLGDDHRAAILTGANSGGKSTFLELLAQLVLLARMGLPVPAVDCQMPWFEQLHLVRANRGLDAGAFETFLRGLLPVSRSDRRRLILADEVEAVTELEAAGRILAFILHGITRSDSMAVLASHLAPQILTHAPDVRVDGIEATGLDEEHRLIVDRNPRIGRMARSTPELIVRRLAKTTRGPDQALYTALLETLTGTEAAPPSRPLPVPVQGSL